MQELAIGQATIELHDSGLTVTRFMDGTFVEALPHDTDEYRARAAELGYGKDTAAMSREHELAHAILARELRLPVSPVLWAVAHGEPPPTDNAWEEAAVLAFQAFARARGIDLVSLGASGVAGVLRH